MHTLYDSSARIVSQVDQFICLSQDAIDVSVKLYFRYIAENDIVVFSYNNECYLYENNAFRRAFEQASKVQAANIRKIPQYDRGISITDAVKKIIHINLNKDGK